MIYITEMAFADPSRLAQWHAHYLRNIANLQTVPGFLASQRFEALADTPSPFSALHEIASADVFESAIYKQRGGRASNGDWQNDMINWHRNLYSGLDATPEVANDAYLLFIDEKREVAEREIAAAAWSAHSLAHAGRARPDHPASGHRRARRCPGHARDRQGRLARQGVQADHQENSADENNNVSATERHEKRWEELECKDAGC